MDDNLIPTEEELDDDAFLASLDDLLKEDSKESEEAEAPPKTKKAPKELKKAKFPLTRLCAVLGAVALCVAAVFGISAAVDHLGGTIQDGVTVGPISVGGMTKGQAKNALKHDYVFLREDNPLTVSLAKRSTKKLDLSVNRMVLGRKDIGLKLDINRAIKDAYSIGRTEDTDSLHLPITPYLTMDTDTIQQTVSAYAEELAKWYIDSGWHLEGDAPDVTSPDFDEDTPCQTLVMDSGIPAVNIDEDVLYSEILEAYETNQPLVNYAGPLDVSSPPLLDLKSISQQVSKAPVEPYIDRETLELVPGVPGYTFDIEQTKTELAHLAFGDTLRVTLHPAFPELSDDDVYFQDVLGHCETPYSNNPKRIVNLGLACKALDGLVLEPGQEFSYNDTLGERTAEKGYQPAPAYSGTTLVDSLGGGICQVSSTLYLASVYAELTILERVNHGFPVHYIPYGMDATVNWGFTDLKMRNDSPLPVKIRAETSDGYVRIDILGTEVRDYDIKMTYSVGGRYVKTFKSKYDKQTGEFLSKEEVALSAYMEDVF